jgi:lipopolysaccharide export system permease protein
MQLLKHSYIMASVITVVVALLMIYGSPLIAMERTKLLRSSGVQTLIQTIIPSRFQALPGGKQVFYVESMSRDHTQAKDIFFAKQTKKDGKLIWDILWAEKAFAETDKKTFEDYVVLQAGKEYQGVPGHADYQIAEFAQYKVRLPHPVIAFHKDIRTAKTASLWPLNNSNKEKATELQWRLSVPLMVLTLTLVAVPLSRVNPRSGKFAKLLPAILIYIVYANLLFFSRNAMMKGHIPVWIGMWWLHLLVVFLGLFLIWRNQVKLT